MQIVITLLAIALLYVWVIVRSDTRRFVVREYEIVSPKIRAAHTLCVLSDLHEKDYGEGNRPLAEAILAIQPDAVLSAGDLITSHHNPEKFNDTAVLSLLKALTEKIPVYAGCGNHERKLRELDAPYDTLGKDYEERLSGAGVRVLHDAVCGALFEDADLAALDLDISYYTRGAQKKLTADDVRTHLGKPDPSRFTILIAHEPGRFPAYADWGADLVLSGHVHGGVARLFGRGVISPAMTLFPFYDGGAFARFPADGPTSVSYGNTNVRSNRDGVVRHPDGRVLYLKDGMCAMVESRGLGTHSIHVRFMNPGELAVIRLTPGAQS